MTARLCGTARDERISRELALINSKNNTVAFERAAIDIFGFMLPDLGTIDRIMMTFEPKAPCRRWKLEWVEVVRCDELQMLQRFSWQSWVYATNSINAVDHQRHDVLVLSREVAVKQSYTVIVETSKRQYAHTDANVFISLEGIDNNGTKRSSGMIHLENSLTNDLPFGRSQRDEFEVLSNPVRCLNCGSNEPFVGLRQATSPLFDVCLSVFSSF